MSITPRTTQGFTLVEMIVSVGLFSVVMLITTAAYLAIISLDKEARATNALVSNLSFAVDSMSRNIRTGTAYSCNGGTNGTPCATSFSFTDVDGSTQVTYLRIATGENAGTIGQCTSGVCTDATAIPLTDSRITITALNFLVRNVGTSDRKQPEVHISIRGTMPARSGRVVNFTIQTSATQRQLELP